MKRLWTTFRYTFRNLRGQILGWGLSLGLYGLMIVPMYETFVGQGEQFQQMIASYPPEFLAWGSAWLGAILAAIVAMAGLAIVALYFRFVRLNTALSVAGGVAVVLIGINYLAQIFLFGAVLCRKIGSQEDAATSGPVS